jgi:hypothetical protein
MLPLSRPIMRLTIVSVTQHERTLWIYKCRRPKQRFFFLSCDFSLFCQCCLAQIVDYLYLRGSWLAYEAEFRFERKRVATKAMSVSPVRQEVDQAIKKIEKENDV